MWFSRVTPLLYLLMLPVQPVMWIFWFPIYGIVCLLLCLAEGQTSSMFYRLDDTLAEVSPSSLMDGYVNETDGQFTIQCRILNNYYENSDLTPEKINSSSLYWSYNRRVLDHAYIVDQRTLGVTVQNITTLMSGKYHCKMNESAIGGKSDKSMVTTEITIGNPPEPVTSIKCVSLNWLEMICYWCPSKPVKHLSKYTLRYQINGIWHSCAVGSGKKTVFSCECSFCGLQSRDDKNCPKPAFQQNSSYHMFVISKYEDFPKFGYTRSADFNITSNIQIVKPGPVKDLNVVAINSTALNITWSPNEKMVTFDQYNTCLYVVHYKSEWEEDSDKEQTVNVDIKKSLILTNLRPYTRYDIAVRSKTKSSENISLYWSDWVNETQRTEISNPNIGPPMSACSYKWLDCNNGENKEMLRLFWQEIPKIDRNGEIGGYNIQLHDIKANKTLRDSVAGSKFSNGRFSGCLNAQGRAYRVEIEAETAPHLLSPPTVLHIESDPSIKPRNIYAEVDSESKIVHFAFDIDGTVDNFTLLRCLPDKYDHSFCKTPPVVHTISGNKRAAKVEDWKFGEVFAIGASRDQYSSGLTKDWIPLCHKGKIPGKPKFHVNVEKERSLTVKWDRVECSDLLGVPSDYKVIWSDGIETFPALITKREEQYRYVIEDLKPATLYNVSVVAWSPAGYSQSDTQSHTTKYSAPGDPPQNVTVQDIGADYLTIQCDPPTQPNGEIHQYYVFVTGGSQVNVTKNYPAGEMHEGVNVTNLDGHTNYSVSLQADNMQGGEGGLSDISTPLYVFTHIGHPSEVEISYMTFVNKTTVRVAWDPPDPPNGPLEHMWYRIESQLGNKTFRNESRNTKVDLSFNKDCGSDSEEVMVRVTALMKEDPQNVLKGQPSSTVKETICGLTSIPVFYFNIAHHTNDSTMSVNVSVQDNSIEGNVSVGISGDDDVLDQAGDVITKVGRLEEVTKNPLKERELYDNVMQKFTWMEKMTHICRWRENYRFYKLYKKYYGQKLGE